MEANNILRSDILDIIFEGKNKLYGAYDLRKTYNNRLVKALSATFILLLLFFAGALLAGNSGKKEFVIDVGPDIDLHNVRDEIKPTVPEVLTPKVPVENQVRFVKPIVVDNDKVKPDEIVKNINDDQVISSQTIKSENTVHVIQAPITDLQSGINEIPAKRNEEPSIYAKVEIDAEFPGGFSAWRNYLEKNLDADIAINNGAPEGTYTVKVRFVVSKDGTISNVVSETKLGYGMEEEAVKIISKGPKWIPAIQNGQQVNAYRDQPITFVVSGGN